MKVIIIILILGLIYSGFLLFSNPKERDFVIPKNKEQQYQDIYKEIKEKRDVKKQAKVQAAAEVKQRDNIKKAEVEKVQPKEDASEAETFVKIKESRVEKDTLFVSLYFFNNRDYAVDNNVKVVCELLFEGKAIDKLMWMQKIPLKPKKTILIKDIDFGYVVAKEFDDLKCAVN